MLRYRNEANNKTRHSIAFPKSAYTKLCQQAVQHGPFVRPLSTLFPTLASEPAGLSQIRNATTACADTNDGEHNNLQEWTNRCWTIGHRYEPYLKKSLWQLDQFLASACSVSINACHDILHVSSRQPTNTHTNKPEKEHVYDETPWNPEFHIPDSSAVGVAAKELVAAWNVFCRSLDSEPLTIPTVAYLSTPSTPTLPSPHSSQAVQYPYYDNLWHGSIQKNRDEVDNTKDERKAAMYGQYFASEDNAQKVVNVAVQYLTGLSHTKLDANGKEFQQVGRPSKMIDWNRIVFVEPSCGDGCILIQLLQHPLLTLLLPKEQVVCRPRIMGYDIDQHAIQACQEKLRLYPYCNANSEFGSTRVTLRCTNFLELTREALLLDLESAPKLVNDGATTRSSCHDDENSRFIFIGGPPYNSTGPGRGSSFVNEEEDDLPFRFIYHCIMHLGGEAVIFLLPKRCEKHVDKIRHHLNRATQRFGANRDQYEDDDDTTIWSCTTHHLDESLFYFQRKAVRQPSVLQIWSRQPFKKQRQDERSIVHG